MLYHGILPVSEYHRPSEVYGLIGSFTDEHIAPSDPLHQGAWYVVTSGLQVGIFKTWAEAGVYVLGVSHSVYQKIAGPKKRRRAELIYQCQKNVGRVYQLCRDD